MGVFGDPVGVVGSLLYFLLRLLLMGGVGLRRGEGWSYDKIIIIAVYNIPGVSNVL